MAAEHAHTNLIQGVHFEPRSATTSLPNGPSLAQLHASSFSNKDSTQNRMALLKRRAGANHANHFPCSMQCNAVIANGENKELFACAVLYRGIL